MKKTIEEFVHQLRKPGIRISPSETLDCLRGLEHIDLLDKGQFRALLESTLIKKSGDIPEFHRLFHLYFEKHEHSGTDDILSGTMGRIADIFSERGDDFTSEFRDFMLSGIEGMMPYLFSLPGANTGESNPYTIMPAYRSMKAGERMEKDKWGEQLSLLLELLESHGEEIDDIAYIRRIIGERTAKLKALSRDLLENEKNNWKAYKTRQGNSRLMNTGFRALNIDDAEEMKRAVHELVRRIRDEIARREKRNSHGRIDIKRTIRRSQQYGGIPFELIWKKRKKSKGKIVALCDVSNSVKNASQFMLTLLYSLQDQFSKVRSFVFVNDLGEVTDFFKDHDIHTGIAMALTDAGISYNSYTDYGNVLLRFHENYMDTINSRTTVIIIGDGRNNYSHTMEWVLEKMKSRAKRIFWLNPEETMTWGFGDSAVLIYKKHCTEVLECWKVSQLMDFIKRLVF